MSETNPDKVVSDPYEVVRCNCGWPLFRVYHNGLAIKHHGCNVVDFFNWGAVREWGIMGSALQ